MRFDKKLSIGAGWPILSVESPPTPDAAAYVVLVSAIVTVVCCILAAVGYLLSQTPSGG